MAGVVRAVEQAPSGVRSDINVIQLMPYAVDDKDYRHIVTWVAWNTDAHLRVEQAGAVNPVDRSSREWNSMSYSEPQACKIGEATEDPEGASIRKRFLQGIGLWEEDDESDDDRDADRWDALLDSLVEAARVLHGDGVLETLIGRDVPVFIAEYLIGPEDLSKANRRANPQEFHERLDRWSTECYTAGIE